MPEVEPVWDISADSLVTLLEVQNLPPFWQIRDDPMLAGALTREHQGRLVCVWYTPRSPLLYPLDLNFHTNTVQARSCFSW